MASHGEDLKDSTCSTSSDARLEAYDISYLSIVHRDIEKHDFLCRRYIDMYVYPMHSFVCNMATD